MSNTNHPPHYGGQDNPQEAIKVIEAHGLGFHLGNVIKYVLRAGKKGDMIEDLEKAMWYIERKLAMVRPPSIRIESAACMMAYEIDKWAQSQPDAFTSKVCIPDTRLPGVTLTDVCLHAKAWIATTRSIPASRVSVVHLGYEDGTECHRFKVEVAA